MILLLVLLLFGPKKIPEIARMVGRGMNEFKKVQREINSEITRYSSEVENEARDMQSEIDNLVREEPAPKQPGVAQQEPTDAPEADEAAEDTATSSGDDPDDDLPYPYNQKTGDS